MNVKTMIGSTALLAGCPKQQEQKTAIDFSQSLPQIIAAYLVNNDYASQRYPGMYSHSIKTVNGPMTVFYKPKDVILHDSSLQDDLFLIKTNFLNDVFILGLQNPPFNYVDIGLDETIDYIGYPSGQYYPHASFAVEDQEWHSAHFELPLFEFVETLERTSEKR